MKRALKYEKIRHKYNRGAILLELLGAVIVLMCGSMIWAALMSVQVFGMLLRECTHADFLVPKSDEEIKKEAVAIGAYVSGKYVILGMLMAVIEYVGVKNGFPLFTSSNFGKMINNHTAYTMFFLLLCFVNSVVLCISMSLKRNDMKKKAIFENTVWGAVELIAFIVVFSAGLDMQGLHFLWFGGSYEGIRAWLMMAAAMLILIVHCFVLVKNFKAGDFFGTEEEMVARYGSKAKGGKE